MLKETQLCSWSTSQPLSRVQPWSSPIADDNDSLLIMSSIMAQQCLENSDVWVESVADSYPHSDAERIAFAGGLDDLSALRPKLTLAQRGEKARIVRLERGVLFKLSEKGLALSTEEKLTPLAALNLAWWLNQEQKPTLAELSASIYQPEHKNIRIEAAILYNRSHYGNRYGDIARGSTADLNDWTVEQFDAPELPVSRAAKALRIIHEGMNDEPAILHSDKPYLANSFAPKNAQGTYLKESSPELGEMILAGCGQIGFTACSQQDFTQFVDSQYAVGSLGFSLKTTLKLHYQLHGNAPDDWESKSPEQLYSLLLQEEAQLHQSGGGRYSPMIIFLSHFSQSNEYEPLNLEQTATLFKRIAGTIEVSDLPERAQTPFNRIKQLADNIVKGTADDLESERFVSEMKALAIFLGSNHPIYKLTQHGIYKTEQEKIKLQLDYLDMRLAYRHPPAAFDEDQAIRDILSENHVSHIDFPREYTFRRDLQFGFPQKEFDSPIDEFKRRRNASNHFVANMSMMGKNGRPINVFDTMQAKKAQYYAQLRFHPAVMAQAIQGLINQGERPKGILLQHKITLITRDYQPESENSRFWGNAWASLEKHWVCKLPLPNPMCTIAKVEGPRYRDDKEGIAAGMTAMLMEAGQLRGMERGVKMIESPSPQVSSDLPSLPAEIEEVLPNETSGTAEPAINEPATNEPATAETRELNSQTIQNPHGKPIEVQRIDLKDPQVSGGMREAWVRQGGSGTYWEVDLTTGKDLGVVLKQGPEFSRLGRLPGGGPSLSKTSTSEFNPEIKLGKKIGSGEAGEVYLDANNPGFLLKKFKVTADIKIIQLFTKEVEFFNRYYGEDSAELIAQGNQYYIRMRKVPGKALVEINTKIFPANAKERFLSMMDDLGYYNIIHDDLNFTNVLYDVKTNTFYPIDFDNAYDGYYSPRDNGSNDEYWGIDMRFKQVLEHIEKYTKK